MKMEKLGSRIQVIGGRLTLPLTGVVMGAAALVALLLPDALAAQEVNPAASSPQMRHFWHVFAAYAIAWILLFGWLVSIGRRLARVEGRLGS